MSIRSLIKSQLFKYQILRTALVYYFVFQKPSRIQTFAKELIRLHDLCNLERLIHACFFNLERNLFLLVNILELKDINDRTSKLVIDKMRISSFTIESLVKRLETFNNKQKHNFYIRTFNFPAAEKTLPNDDTVSKIHEKLNFLEFYNMAISNQLNFFAQKDYLAYNPKNKTTKSIASLSQKDVLVFAIPLYIYDQKNKSSALDDVIEFYKECMLLLRDMDYFFVFVFQRWAYFHSELEDLKTISYHTLGGKNRLHIKESAFKRYFTVDKNGYSGWHSINSFDLEKSIQEVEEEASIFTFRKLYEEFVVNNVSKYSQNQSSIKLPDDFIFLPLQVYNDAVSELAWINTLELLDLVSIFCIRNKKNLVIKRHPKCPSTYVSEKLAYYSKFPNIHVSENNVHSIIEKSNVVVTVNSGVGFESLLHLKPVITTGNCDYSFATLQAKNEKELYYYLNTYLMQDKSPALKKKFLHYYFTNHLFLVTDSTKIESRLNDFIKSASD